MFHAPAMRLRARQTTCSVLVGLVLVACSAPDDSPPQVQSSDPVVAEARDAGASSEQLAILEKGPVPSYEDYEFAVNRALRCMTDVGIDVQGPDIGDEWGTPVLTYLYASSSSGRTDEETDEIAQSCLTEHSRFVERAWQTQPAAVEAQDAALEAARPKLIACIRENGLQIDDDAPIADVVATAVSLGENTKDGLPCTYVAGLAGQ